MKAPNFPEQQRMKWGYEPYSEKHYTENSRRYKHAAESITCCTAGLPFDACAFRTHVRFNRHAKFMAARPHKKIDWDADVTVGFRLLGWETPWKNIQQTWRKQQEGHAPLMQNLVSMASTDQNIFEQMSLGDEQKRGKLRRTLFVT